MRSIVRIIDSINEFVGKLVSWLCLALVMALVYEVTARYVFNQPTIWAHILTPMIGFTIIALGWAYVHRHKGHIRLDLFYVRLSPRGQACVDVICTLLMFFPVIILLVYISAAHVWYSWSIGERLTVSWRSRGSSAQTCPFTKK